MALKKSGVKCPRCGANFDDTGIVIESKAYQTMTMSGECDSDVNFGDILGYECPSCGCPLTDSQVSPAFKVWDENLYRQK